MGLGSGWPYCWFWGQDGDTCWVWGQDGCTVGFGVRVVIPVGFGVRVALLLGLGSGWRCCDAVPIPLQLQSAEFSSASSEKGSPGEQRTIMGWGHFGGGDGGTSGVCHRFGV